MPIEIVALIDKPWLLAAVLGVGAFFGIAVERLAESQQRARRRAYFAGRKVGRQRGSAGQIVPFKVATERVGIDAADQLRIVMAAKFSSRPLLNQGERRLLAHLDRALDEHSPGWRAMGQVSLGEILASPDDEAFRAINTKRVDLLIVDAECRPLHAVEFQGRGHHQGTAAARDAVKKEALRRAGIGYVEVVSGDTPVEVRELVRRLVGRAEGSGVLKD